MHKAAAVFPKHRGLSETVVEKMSRRASRIGIESTRRCSDGCKQRLTTSSHAAGDLQKYRATQSAQDAGSRADSSTSRHDAEPCESVRAQALYSCAHSCAPATGRRSELRSRGSFAPPSRLAFPQHQSRLRYREGQLIAAMENLQREDLNPVDEVDILDVLPTELFISRDDPPAFLSRLRN